MFLVLTTSCHAHIPLGSQCRSSTRYWVTLRCPLAQAKLSGVSPRLFTDAVGGKGNVKIKQILHLDTY